MKVLNQHILFQRTVPTVSGFKDIPPYVTMVDFGLQKNNIVQTVTNGLLKASHARCFIMEDAFLPPTQFKPRIGLPYLYAAEYVSSKKKK